MIVSTMTHESLESAAPVSSVVETSIRTEWRAVLILALWFVAVAMTVGVYRDIPVIDDWTYAWSVERLLDQQDDVVGLTHRDRLRHWCPCPFTCPKS